MSKSKKLYIPEQWSEIKYKDFYRFITSIKDQEDDEQLVLEMCLQYLCNISTDDYYALDKKSFEKVTSTVTTLISNQANQPLVKSFEAFGVEYRLEPDMENMSYGMYLDLTEYGKDVWKNMPIICSILYRPLDTKLGAMYTIKPYTGTKDDTIDMFREMLTMDICHSVVGFFLSIQKDLLIHSLISSLKTVKKELTFQQLETLASNGVDTEHLLHSVMEISRNSTKSQP